MLYNSESVAGTWDLVCPGAADESLWCMLTLPRIPEVRGCAPPRPLKPMREMCIDVYLATVSLAAAAIFMDPDLPASLT